MSDWEMRDWEMRGRLAIGLDIGGTSTKAGVIDAGGAIVGSTAIPTRPGADGVVATAAEAAYAVAAVAGLSIEDIGFVGIGIPGNVDPRRGSVVHAVNLGIGGDRFELGPRLSALLDRPVHVENDVRAAALGADWYLADEGRPVDALAYLSIGTGIAAGYVEHGRVRRGSNLVAGEIGHIPIDPSGPRCVCGQVGCIEAISSGSAIERMWPTPGGSAATALEQAAREGDEEAARLWHGVLGGLGRAVLILGLTWDPRVVVLSGGVASLGERLHDALVQRLAEDAQDVPFLRALDLGRRLRVIEPSVPLGPIGAVRAAMVADPVALP